MTKFMTYSNCFVVHSLSVPCLTEAAVVQRGFPLLSDAGDCLLPCQWDHGLQTCPSSKIFLRARANPILLDTHFLVRHYACLGSHPAALCHTGALRMDFRVRYCLFMLFCKKQKRASVTSFSLAVENRIGSPLQCGVSKGPGWEQWGNSCSSCQSIILGLTFVSLEEY